MGLDCARPDEVTRNRVVFACLARTDDETNISSQKDRGNWLKCPVVSSSATGQVSSVNIEQCAIMTRCLGLPLRCACGCLKHRPCEGNP